MAWNGGISFGHWLLSLSLERKQPGRPWPAGSCSSRLAMTAQNWPMGHSDLVTEVFLIAFFAAGIALSLFLIGLYLGGGFLSVLLLLFPRLDAWTPGARRERREEIAQQEHGRARQHQAIAPGSVRMDRRARSAILMVTGNSARFKIWLVQRLRLPGQAANAVGTATASIAELSAAVSRHETADISKQSRK